MQQTGQSSAACVGVCLCECGYFLVVSCCLTETAGRLRLALAAVFNMCCYREASARDAHRCAGCIGAAGVVEHSHFMTPWQGLPETVYARPLVQPGDKVSKTKHLESTTLPVAQSHKLCSRTSCLLAA